MSLDVKPVISIIAAMGSNRELGKDNQLLWHLPADLKRFKSITQGHPVIMGRKTFESIGRPLPKRTNVVISSQENYQPKGVTVVSSLMQALILAPELDEEEVFIIGGGRVYAESLGFADRLYLTLVHGEFEAGTFFPEYQEQFGTVIEEKSWQEGEFSGEYLTLER